MASRQVNAKPAKPTRPRAKTPEDREAQIVALAVDLAEKQIREGTVSAQVLAHYVKQGSPREKLERQKMELEQQLLEARTEAMKSAANMEELYKEAIQSMRTYGKGFTDVD